MPVTDIAMQHRRFGRTELAMPVYSTGGMRYQDGWKDKPLAEIDPKTQVTLETTLNRGLELGVNHVETARGYGPSERQLGQYFKKVGREKFIIQTKVSPDKDPKVFRESVLDSLDRLELEYIDLFAIHGINTPEKLEWTVRPGGCFDQIQDLRKQGRCRFVGFSTHGSVDIINQAIAFGEPEVGKGFDFINLHYYYIYQETLSCLQAAQQRDMGTFIISPNDKGGLLYKPSDLLRELCSPLDPMAFNDLFCLGHDSISTLSVGAARPSDYDIHMEALPFVERPGEFLNPVLERMNRRYEDVVAPELRDPWNLGLPRWQDIPGQINVGRIVQLYNLSKAYDMEEYGKFRYNMLGAAEDWVPGLPATPDNIEPVRDELMALFEKTPAGTRLMSVIEEANERLYEKPRERLSGED
jgi:predicted aldo/keto reductase-like oxidoreductase